MDQVGSAAVTAQAVAGSKLLFDPTSDAADMLEAEALQQDFEFAVDWVMSPKPKVRVWVVSRAKAN